jgi:pilus assembly protein Flp/PilA
MLSLLKRFHRHERGATAVEYAMLVVFIALAIAVGAQTLGTDLGNMFSNVGEKLANITIPSP